MWFGVDPIMDTKKPYVSKRLDVVLKYENYSKLYSEHNWEDFDNNLMSTRIIHFDNESNVNMNSKDHKKNSHGLDLDLLTILY